MRSSADLATAVEALARGLERWLLPGECLLCSEPVPRADDDALICSLCRSRWRAVPHPVCARCGQPAAPGDDCRICESWPAGFGPVRSAVWLEGGAHAAVHRLKYDGWWRAAEAMAEAMRGLEPLTGRISLIPVPLGARRLRRRGYNQAERLASALARRLGVEVLTDRLARCRETRTQTALTPDARRSNVADAFRARDVAGRICVLVDDVFTTGATLAAAADALRAAGAAEVRGVTFARATLPL